MTTIVLNILEDEALSVLKTLEEKKQITIINEEEAEIANARKVSILNELDHYTYENILKTLKKSES